MSVYISYQHDPSTCLGCKKKEELRFGYCFDCAHSGELRAAKRPVMQHIKMALTNVIKKNRNWKYDIRWAWERATRTGDYKSGGYLEQEHGMEIWK